jgi:DNA-binding transcriptional regulator YiaG
MANVASVLKEEITRLARKEFRSETEKLKKASVHYRSEIAALKRRAVELERQVSRLAKGATKNIEVEASPETAANARFTAKGFRTLRKRLGLTAEAIGALLGVSAQTIYNWEAENFSPREQQMVRIVMLRGMGKREVDAILQGRAR